MTQYEIGEIDLTAQATAAKTATDYIAFDPNTGLKIASLNPLTATRRVQIASDKISIYNDDSNYTYIDSNGLTIYKGGNNIANFNDIIRLGKQGDSRLEISSTNGLTVYKTGNDIANFNDMIRLGKQNNSRIEVDYRSFQMFDRDNNKYVHLSDLRDENGYITITERFVQESDTDSFSLQFIIRSTTTLIVKVNDVLYTRNQQYSVYSVSTNNSSGIRFYNSYIPSQGDNIEVTYETAEKIYAYTFGQRQDDSIIGPYSLVVGQGVASNFYSFSQGYNTYANGKYSHAEGYNTYAKSNYSHAEGYNTYVNGNYSHAEGYFTTANGRYSHAEGDQTYANGSASHAECLRTHADGDYSHAEGSDTFASGSYSHAEGNQTRANGTFSHAEGNQTHANGSASHAEGLFTYANGSYSHTEGSNAFASGSYSHAEGYNTRAEIDAAHAEGYGTTATNGSYPSFGVHAEGYFTTANGRYGAHAEGYNTVANGGAAHAEGANTIANGWGSHAAGEGTIANSSYQFVCGKWNRKTSAYFVVGSGINSGDNGRKNVLTVYTSSAYVNGTVSSDGTSITSDIRVKENIKLLNKDKSIQFINQLKPSSYIKHGNKKELGFIAQDIEKIKDYKDYLVTIDNSGEYDLPNYRLLNYQGLIAPTVAALQGALEKIEILENKIEILENKIEILENNKKYY